MAIKIDFTGVKDNAFEPWPVGEEINFNIVEITEKTSKKGDPMIEFKLKQVGGNRFAWRNFVMTAAALWALKKFLVDLGMPKEGLEGKFSLDPKKLLGTEIVATFGPEEEYNGRMSQNIETVRLASTAALPW